MTALPQMRAMGWPVCMDGTHSTQLPGGAGQSTGGRREMVPYLTRSAVAAGVDALFLEVHPNPELALSDAATMLRLADLRGLLEQVVAIDAIVRGVSTVES